MGFVCLGYDNLLGVFILDSCLNLRNFFENVSYLSGFCENVDFLNKFLVC